MHTSSGKPPLASHENHHLATAKKFKNLAVKLKATIQSVKSQNSKCLATTVLIHLLVIIFLLLRASPPPFLYHLTASTKKTENTCNSGRIYIYDLPPMLNKDLITNCQDLDPYGTRCDGVSNVGLGPPATRLTTVVPKTLLPAWYWTHMYLGEVIYHDRMTNYKCRTLDQHQATAFYIPFYAALAVGKYLFNHTAKDRDFHAVQMLKWVQNQPAWKKSNGLDHFIMLGRLTWTFRRETDKDSDWGTKLLNMPLMKNVLRLSIEKSQSDFLEISVPYPTSFHPTTVRDINEWQRFVHSRERTGLFSFVGATREKVKNDLRGMLMSYCNTERESKLSRVVDCSVVNCNDGAPEIMEAFLDTDFCLQPAGDGFTRRSTFDCMLAGSIPVYFSRESFEGQYEWHLPSDPASYSVFIDREKVIRNGTSVIREVLQKYSREDVKRMREGIIDSIIPRILYSKSNSELGDVKDAFDIAMDGVLSKFKQQNMVAL